MTRRALPLPVAWFLALSCLASSVSAQGHPDDCYSLFYKASRKGASDASVLDAIDCYAKVLAPSRAGEPDQLKTLELLTELLKWGAYSVERCGFVVKLQETAQAAAESGVDLDRYREVGARLARHLTPAIERMEADGYLRVKLVVPKDAEVILPPRPPLPQALYIFRGPLDWWFPIGEDTRVHVDAPGFESFEATLRPEQLPRERGGNRRVFEPALIRSWEIVAGELASLLAQDDALQSVGGDYPCSSDGGTPTPAERIDAWRAFKDGVAKGWPDAVEQANTRVSAWQTRADCYAKLEQARVLTERPAGRGEVQDALTVFDELDAVCTPAGGSFGGKGLALRQAWRAITCDDLQKRWTESFEAIDCEEGGYSKTSSLAPLESDAALAGCSWSEQASRERRDCERTPGRRYVPHATLQWGRLPDQLWSTDAFATHTFPVLRQARPDYDGDSLRLRLGGLYTGNAIRAHGAGTDVTKNVEAPLPLSPRFDFSATNSVALGAIRLGIFHPHPLGAGRLQDAGLRGGGVAALVDSGAEVIASMRPDLSGVFGILFGLGGSMTPVDWVNASFPYPANVIRTYGSILFRFGDPAGIFEVRFGGGASFRTTPFGSLPQALFKGDSAFEDVAPPEPPADPWADESTGPDTTRTHEGLFYLGLAPQASFVVRPWAWIEVLANWRTTWAHVPESPTTNGTWPRADEYSGQVVLGFLNDDLARPRFVVDAEWGYRFLARGGPQAGAYPHAMLGHMVASWRHEESLDTSFLGRINAEIHVGIEDEFDPVSFIGDYLDLWMIGFGAQATLETRGALAGGLERMHVSLDFARALPIFRSNLRGSLGRPGFDLSGADVRGAQSRLSYSALRFAFDAILWRSITTGVDYTRRDAHADIQVTSPFGQAFTFDPSVSVTHIVTYHIGYRF